MTEAWSTTRGWRLLKSRPRLVSAILAGLLVWVLLPRLWVAQEITRVLVAWNLGAVTYLVLAVRMVLRSSAEQIRRRALHQDDGRFLVLVLAVLASSAVLVAVGSQLAAVKDMTGLQRSGHISLAAFTVVVAWLFIQTTFALHYAHDFFVARAQGRPDELAFPGTPDPVYTDFLYFAAVIGTSGQTADVSFISSSARVLGGIHCMLAFFFNTTVLALTINIAASLF